MSKAWLVSRQAVIAMIATYILSLSLIYAQAQWWVLLFGGACVAWRGAMLLGKTSLIKTQWRVALTLLIIVFLGATAKQVGLLAAMVNLLLLGYGLKFLELNRQRDAFVLPLVGLLTIGVMFIFNSELMNAVLGWALIVLNFTVLVAICAPSVALIKQAKLAFKIIGLSLPLTALLFVIMPQLAPLWKMPSAKAATTGLADSMTPGDIARLGQDDSLAFSVTFDGKIPAREQLYWRALVMDQFDGRRWQQSEQTKLRQQQLPPKRDWRVTAPDLLGAGISYQVMTKTSNQSWLFGLALPTSTESNVIETLDFNLISTERLVAPKAYRVTSYPQLMSRLVLSPSERRSNLERPSASNGETKRWVAQLRSKYDDQQLIDYVLNYFNKNPYRYTLTPPPLGADSVDQFMFSTKQGFCAHYASAFTLIMRYAGIPSRIVAGYLGGEWNEDVGYLNVYQYDAHAWSEVWLAGKGWVRVDPTASVAPERVEQGLAESLDDGQSFLSDSALSLVKYRQVAWLNTLRIKFANVEYYWSRWLLGYDKNKQNQLLSMILGQLTPIKLIMFTLSCLMGVSLWLLIAGGFRLKRLTPQQRVERQYLRVIRACASEGVSRKVHLTPTSYQQLVIKRLPHLSEEITDITTRYNRMRFVRARSITHQDMMAFTAASRRLLNKI